MATQERGAAHCGQRELTFDETGVGPCTASRRATAVGCTSLPGKCCSQGAGSGPAFFWLLVDKEGRFSKQQEERKVCVGTALTSGVRMSEPMNDYVRSRFELETTFGAACYRCHKTHFTPLKSPNMQYDISKLLSNLASYTGEGFRVHSTTTQEVQILCAM